MASLLLNTVRRAGQYVKPMLFVVMTVPASLMVLLDVIRGRITLDEIFPDYLRTPRDALFSHLWKMVSGLVFRMEEASNLPDLLKHASGVVVEVGPASGKQLVRYNASKVKKLYLIEPNAGLHDALRDNAQRVPGLRDKYTIIPTGAEDSQRLSAFGLKEGSVDTLVVVHVLCSVPDPQAVLRDLYKLLKPGGQMIFFEHVKAKDPISLKVQELYNTFWPWLLGNCHLTRPSGEYALQVGRWARVEELHEVEKEDPWLVLPHASGRLFKA